MASTGSVFSETLQSITNTKLEEVSKKRATFEGKYSIIQAALQQEQNPLQRLFILVEGVKICFSVRTATSGVSDLNGEMRLGRTIECPDNEALETHLMNADRFLEQSRFDPSISAGLITEWEHTLSRYLQAQSLKYSYATLYGQVVNEWLSGEGTSKSPDGNVEIAGSFEKVPGAEKMEARAAWEASAFDPGAVDKSALQAYLRELFANDDDEEENYSEAFEELQEAVKEFEAGLARPKQVTRQTILAVIQGLLKTDILTDEKRAVLDDFRENSVVLGEITDVLNMRMAELQDWNWGEYVLIEQKMRVNGTYGIHLHADLLHALFLQFIGIKWGVFFKQKLGTFLKKTVVKISTKSVPEIDRKRRERQLGLQSTTSRSLESRRRRLYRSKYLLYQLPSHERQQAEKVDGEMEFNHRRVGHAGKLHSTREMQKQIAAAPSGGWVQPESTSYPTINACMAINPKPDDDMDDEEEVEKNPMNAKHTLLHLIATEIAINTRLHGEFTCFHSSFKSWNDSVSHTTITTILEFFGVSKKWLDFFRKYLAMPLKFLDESASPRTRQRGMPGSDLLSNVFGEVTLFCLDFSVARKAKGSFIHRIYDDLWFWSPDHSKCVKAWRTLEKFAEVMGASLDLSSSGTAHIVRGSAPRPIGHEVLPSGQIKWGFLYLDPEKGTFEIDQSIIDMQIEGLRRRIQDARSSIFKWILAWNTYATTYLTKNFGKPANSFGKEHVDKILSSYERIHRTLFSGNDKSVLEHVKAMLKERFGVDDIPDGFLLFPIELGGLELKNPFIGPLQVRDSVLENPSTALDKFEAAEKEAYKNAASRFESGWPNPRRHKIPEIPGSTTFMPFEEYIRYRELFNYSYTNQLADVFDQLMEPPKAKSVECNMKLVNAIDAMDGKARSIASPWSTIEPYWQAVAELYGNEIIERFGGMNIVNPGLLPTGMVSLFRQQRALWDD